MLSRKKRVWIATLVLGAIVLANVIAFIHAYKFTHFTTAVAARTGDPESLSATSRVKLLFTGIDNPRPIHKQQPAADLYETVWVNSPHKLECWLGRDRGTQGTVVLFHGYAGEKSSLLERAAEFSKLGYTTLLVDFTGSGGSEGNGTSVGYKEAVQVKACMEYAQNLDSRPVILFGTSMGAAAILKAMDDYPLKPTAIVLECPFGSLYKTVCARFDIMGVPAFPMAGLLCFWGGAQNGYWAFGHNPSAYAAAVKCPTLLLYGQQDERVSMEETEAIYTNLQGPKTLKVYPEAGHNTFIPTNRQTWVTDVTAFVNSL